MIPSAINNAPLAAEVREAEMSEQQLIDAARDALDRCNWTVGRLASEWKRRFAGDRTDGDFAQLTGLDRGQVQQRRQCWEQFGAERSRWHSLTFTHFRNAIGWDNARDLLQWAHDNGASVKEMTRYRAKQEQEKALRRGDLIPTNEDPEVIVKPPSRTRPAPDPEPEVFEAQYTVTTSPPAQTPTRPAGASDRKPDPEPVRQASNATAAQPASPAGPAKQTAPMVQTIGDIRERLAVWVKAASPVERTKQAAELAVLSLGMLPDWKFTNVAAVLRPMLTELLDGSGDETAAAIGAELRAWAGRFPAGTAESPDEQPESFALSPAGSTPSDTPGSVTAHQVILNRWNMLGQFQPAAQLTTKRRAAMKSRLSDTWWREHWSEACDILQQVTSGFLTGDNERGWKANLDWFLRPNTVTSIIEGAYRSDGTPKSQRDRDAAFSEVFGRLADGIQ